ncbi:MAG: ABC transporter substrate-binding protein [Alphaproteobacteria bacterium]|nr:ABC transporter substrate-binding protein [Alphaproteobacteria bacterium]
MSAAWRGAALAALVAAAAAPAAAAGLRIGLLSDPDALDPATGTSFTGRIVFASLCDKLIDIDEKIDFVPQLATSWSWSADGLTLTFKLREGVVFHDGEPFDAAAAKANLDRYRTMPTSRRRAELKPVASVEAPDPTTLVLRLSEANAPLMAVLADRAGMMMSPKAVAAAGDRAGTAPVCSGPFRFKQRVPLERIVLERFDRYWDAAAIHLDSVTFAMVPDNSVRLVNLRAGQLDLIERIAPSDVKTVRGDARLRLESVTGLAYDSILINVGHGDKAAGPLGRSAKVRAAFEASLDRAVINQVVFEGAFTPSNQAEAPGTRYANPERPVPPRDVALAKRLLRESGHERVAFTLRVVNTPSTVQVGEVIQSMAAEAGFDVKVEATEAGTYVAATERGDFEAAIGIWSGRADPDGNITIWIQCDGMVNRGRYCNRELDQLFAQARAVTDVAQRQALYRKATAIYLDERPLLGLYHYTWIWGMSRNLQGFKPHPDGLIRPQGLRFTN